MRVFLIDKMGVALILKFKKEFYGRILLVLAIALTGCDLGDTSALPEDGPEVVTKRFYELISAAKMEGGTTTASEAYKLVDTRVSNLTVNQFLEIIKRYPEKFAVDIGKAEIKGNQALVQISYKLPSSFGGDYTVQEVLPLNVDPVTNTWKVDFTGDSYGMQKDEAVAASKSEAPPQVKSEVPPEGE
ncbi:MAG: hypothetical protein HYS19_04380 [Nitrosomonadales bacterium]|nr:hypothetical protein [Nitrosomonadales bacterium]